MSDAEQQVRAALGGPDLWLKDDGNLQGYGDKPGAGPWWSAESIERLALERDKARENNKENLRKLAALQATPTEGELTVRENGEANSYALLQNGDWLMSILLNGKHMTATQLATLRRLAACWNVCAPLDSEQLEDMLDARQNPPPGVTYVWKLMREEKQESGND